MTASAGVVAIVTGASRGIGFAIAQRFVADGAKVCITGRDRTALETAAKDLGGPEVAIAVAGKGDDADHRAEVIDTVQGAFGPKAINVAAQRTDPDSLLNWFERLIRRRRECPELGFGTLTVLSRHNPTRIPTDPAGRAVEGLIDYQP